MKSRGKCAQNAMPNTMTKERTNTIFPPRNKLKKKDNVVDFVNHLPSIWVSQFHGYGHKSASKRKHTRTHTVTEIKL